MERDNEFSIARDLLDQRKRLASQIKIEYTLLFDSAGRVQTASMSDDMLRSIEASFELLSGVHGHDLGMDAAVILQQIRDELRRRGLVD